eukprot:jgi/Chrpa1/24257/Chrysochromulina_OHIO_Genome00022952-RA
MLTIMTSNMIRASPGTDPTPQRRHGSGVTNSFGRTTAFCSSRAFSALDCTAIASAMCSDDRGDDFLFRL